VQNYEKRRFLGFSAISYHPYYPEYLNIYYIGNLTTPDTTAEVVITPKENSKVDLQFTGGLQADFHGVAVSSDHNLLKFSYAATLAVPVPGDYVSVAGTLSNSNLELSLSYIVEPTGPSTYSYGSYTFKGTRM
jgi:hypothetical protein